MALSSDSGIFGVRGDCSREAGGATFCPAQGSKVVRLRPSDIREHVHVLQPAIIDLSAFRVLATR